MTGRRRRAGGVLAAILAPLVASACEGIAGVRDLTLSGGSTSGAGGCSPSLESCGPPEVATCHGAPCAGAHVSSYRYGDDGLQWGSVVLAADPDVVLVGRANGLLDFSGIASMDTGDVGDPSVTDLFVARLKEDGSPTWLHRFADTDVGGAALAPGGDILVTGGVWSKIDLGGGMSASTRDAAIIRLDSAGQQRWSKRWGDDADQDAKAVAVDRDGNAIVVGLFRGTFQLDPTHVLQNDAAWSLYVVKLDPAGDVLWSKAFGSSLNHLVPTSIAVDGDGSFVFAGYFVDALSFGGDTLKSLDAHESAFVARLDEDGNHIWSEAFGGDGDTRAHGIAFDPEGALFSAGKFTRQTSFGGLSRGSSSDLGTSGFLVKLAPDGTPAWVRAQTEPEGQNFATLRPVYGLAVDTDGKVVIIGDGGYQNGSVVFDAEDPVASTRAGVGTTDLMIAKYSGTGALVWAHLFGDSAHGNSASIDALGRIWATGYFDDNLDLGVPPVHVSHGGNDILLARFSP